MKILTTINGKPLMIQDELWTKLFEMTETEARGFLINEILPLNIILNKKNEIKK